MRDLLLKSLTELAAPLQGLRVLLWGFSGSGFPGGDGAREAAAVLPLVGVKAVYSYPNDPEASDKLRQRYDVTIVANTRVHEVLRYDERIWTAAKRTALYFWDLRPASVAAPLRGRVDRVFLSYSGPWTSPDGVVYDPAQWAEALDCPVGYCPQAAPLRTPREGHNAPRIVFVGDLHNATYHRGRAELTRALGATVLNARDRPGRLAIEARLPTLYRSADYCLSTSPLAPGYTSVRTYSILACGGLLLLRRFPGAERLFAPDFHAILFDTAAEAAERIATLEQHPDIRAWMADNGRELHAQKHTVAHRVLSICRQLAGAEDFDGWL